MENIEEKKTIKPETDFGETYIIWAYLTGFLTFFAIWIYAFASWGFLVGLAIGWLPAIIGAFIAGLLWPLVLLVIIGIVILILSSL